MKENKTGRMQEDRGVRGGRKGLWLGSTLSLVPTGLCNLPAVQVQQSSRLV